MRSILRLSVLAGGATGHPGCARSIVASITLRLLSTPTGTISKWFVMSPRLHKTAKIPMDKLNQWMTLAANVGVLIGIFFLAYEIRQNTDAVHAQTREAILAAGQAELQAVRDDPNLIDSIVREGPLTVDEQVKLYTWLVSALKVREFSWLQRESGVIDEAQWKSELAITQAILRAPRVRSWWDKVGHKTVSDEFREFVDSAIRELPPSNGIYSEQMEWANPPANDPPNR